MYFESVLIDRGYENPHNHEEIPDITGLDNRCACDEDPEHGCQCFVHRGLANDPGPGLLFRDDAPGVSVIGIAEALPLGATLLTEAQFLARLVSAYGWPEGTTMGVDGLPHGPARTVQDGAFYQVGGG